MADSRPPPPDWINAEFLQRVLRSSEEDPQLTVISATANHANAAGDNYASDMYRLIGYIQNPSGQQERRSVIVKCHPQGRMREKLIAACNAFTRETNMMTEILPALFQLLEKADPGKYQPFGARCLYHGEHPIPFLVIEDLKPLGFRMAERRQGLDLNHCTMAMRSLARFHAAGIALLDKNPSALELYNEAAYSEKLKDTFGKFLESAIHSLATEIEKIPEYKEKYAEKLHNIENTFFDSLVKVCKRKEGGWNTLAHCDTWVNNMMFKYSDNKLIDIRFVDYQTASHTSPAIDLQYFLHTSPKEEVRIHHVDDLLRAYYSTLQETLDDLGCSQHLISMEQFHQELQDRVTFGFYAASTVLPIVLADPNEGYDIELSLQSDADNSSNNSKIYTNDSYLQAIQRLLPIFVSNGVI